MSPLTCAVAGVVRDDSGRVLLCRQRQGHRRWALPGGRVRRSESPVEAVVREIDAETGVPVEIVDLVGLYHLGRRASGLAGADPVPLPDVLVHVFRARVLGPVGDLTGRSCQLDWHDPDALPAELTPTTRTAVADALAGRSGVLRQVRRDVDPPADDAPAVPVSGASG